MKRPRPDGSSDRRIRMSPAGVGGSSRIRFHGLRGIPCRKIYIKQRRNTSMPFLTSNRIADVLILSAIFVLVVMVFPVHASDYYVTDGYPHSSPIPSGSGNPVSSWASDGAGGYYIKWVTPTDRICPQPGSSYTRAMRTVSPSIGSYFNVVSNDYSYGSGCHDFGTALEGYPIVAVDYAWTPWFTDTSHSTYLFYVSASNPGWQNETFGNISAAFTANTTTGYAPLTIQFTDQTTNLPTSWNWDFGDNSTHSTQQNPVHTYTNSGTYTVTLTASKTGFSDTEIKTGYITANPWTAPVASFSCSPTNTTSPAVVTCTDSSTNTPTGWLWHLTSYGVSMSPGGSYGAGIYDAVNSTQNPFFNMDGSGKVDVRLTVSNPGGTSQEYKPEYITIAGVAPTPTPTPEVPWPNQTGVCRGSGISLGSGITRAHSEHYQLTDPDGDTYSGQYAIGVVNMIIGQPFFTAINGQYIYSEYSEVDGTLEWRQSYVVETCEMPTPTASVTTYSTPVYPTSTWTYTTVMPTQTYTFTPYTVPPTQPTMYPTITMPPTIATIATIPPQIFTNDSLYNYTITSSPYSKPFVDFIKSFEDIFLAFIPGAPITLVVTPMSTVIGTFGNAVLQVLSLFVLFSSYPMLFFYAGLVLVKYMPIKVQLLIALVLWIDLLLYLKHHYQKKGET